MQKLIGKQIIKEIQYKEALSVKPLTFELTNNNPYKQLQWCNAIAFNQNSSLIVAASHNDIKVFQHIQGKLNQLQLCQNKNQVYTLNFMKKKNDFVSQIVDNSIIIWQENGHNQWNCQQVLNGHSGSVMCLLLNNNDDLIISGSADKTIKFWMKQNQWLCQYTITDHTNCLYSICLNEQQNKFISCSQDYLLLIIESSNVYQKWNVTQKITVDKYGLRLCFITDIKFTFQPSSQKQMHVYEMDSTTKQFRKTKEVDVKTSSDGCDCFLPQQYSKSKCILVNKNGKYLNLMRMQENGHFAIEQFIEFDDHNIFGQLSEDGQYLITWDRGSQEIKIRICKES